MANVSIGRNPRLSCEVQRSPTLPAEIRRLSSAASTTKEDRHRGSPALVTRLMGLEEVPADKPSELVKEKRQRLLGALQRCDEDLKVLKKIIESVRLVDHSAVPASAVMLNAGRVGDKVRTVSEVNCSMFNGDQQQQPSPVSVLDELTRSPLSPSCYSG